MPNPTIQSITERWMGDGRPLFKGSLITGDGTPDDPICYCAQGDVLSQAGWSDEDLRGVGQSKADAEVAKLLGIPRGQAVLLRIVNDRKDGCPQDVLLNPEKIIGSEAQTVIAFWRHLDYSMDKAAWKKVAAAGDAAWAAQGAVGEIMGAKLLRERGQKFFFLPLFGFAIPEEVLKGGN